MVELAPLENFEGSDPKLLIVAIEPFFVGGNQEADFYETQPPHVWRIRSVSIQGHISGSMGGITLVLQGLTSGQSPTPWKTQTVGTLLAASPVDVAAGESFSIIWNTEIADNYSGLGNNYGRNIVLGLPMMYLPSATFISLNGCRNAGSDCDTVVEGGIMLIEKFPLGVLSGGVGGKQENVYLLPQTI